MESAEHSRWRRCAGSAVLVVIFLAGISSGAEANCTSPGGQDGSFIIASQAAADTLSNCSTIAGNVVIQSNALTQITLNGIQIIQGNLAISSCDGLQTIAAPALSQITNNFTLSSLPLLTSVEFPLLDNINGGIYWDALPDLTDVSFGNLTASPYGLPGANVDGDISISSTALSSLAFLNFTHYSTPALIWIKGNQQLNNINLTGLSWGSNSLVIANNGPSAQIFLPDLRSVGDITFGSVGHIDIPSLSQTSASLEISNNSIDVFTAPSLTAIGGNFIVRNNYLLGDLNLPLLTTIGDGPGESDFVVANNTALNTITNLNQLWLTQGNVTLSGNFSNVTLPNLRSIIGGFHLNSSNPALDCTAFDKIADETRWTSSFYSCGAYLPGETKDLAKHYHNSDLQISKSARTIIIIVSIVAGILLCALLMRWYGRRRARRAVHAEEVVDLRDVVVTEYGEGDRPSEGDINSERDRTSEGERLPEYRKIGKSGEVPPGYAEHENAGTHQGEAGNDVPRGLTVAEEAQTE